jgi:hypothetical protein
MSRKIALVGLLTATVGVGGCIEDRVESFEAEEPASASAMNCEGKTVTV